MVVAKDRVLDEAEELSSSLHRDTLMRNPDDVNEWIAGRRIQIECSRSGNEACEDRLARNSHAGRAD